MEQNKEKAVITYADRLTDRLTWLIQLRWAAVVGVVGTLFIVQRVFGFDLSYGALYTVASALFLYNIIFHLILAGIKRKEKYLKKLSVFANAQIAIDLLSLTVLLHFSGGIENPFIFYFIFHVIIASILLSSAAAFLQAAYSVVLLFAIVILEYRGVLDHYCLEGFIPVTLHNVPMYLFGILFVFVTTLFIAVYLASSVSAALRRREKSLFKANALLQEKDRIKSEYVLRVSHDIKESLAAIQGCIEPITSNMLGPLTESQEDLLTTARDRTQKLIFFVNALLEITKIKLTKELKMEEFSFSELLQSVSGDILERAQSKGIKFIIDISDTISKITGIKVYLEEAISNLLINAVKYTPEGGRVNFTIEDRKDKVFIVVSDTGVGIPKEGIPHIFEEFYRAPNVKKLEKQGTGLGLSITKEIVEMHNGRIWFESEENKGTAFYIELPK